MVKGYHFRLTYHISLHIDQEIPKSLHDSLQHAPRQPIVDIHRYHMDRSAIAQIVIKRVFGMRKWYVAASLDLELAIAVMDISLITL